MTARAKKLIEDRATTPSMVALLRDLKGRSDYIEAGSTKKAVIDRGWVVPITAGVIGPDRLKYELTPAGEDALAKADEAATKKRNTPRFSYGASGYRTRRTA